MSQPPHAFYFLNPDTFSLCRLQFRQAKQQHSQQRRDQRGRRRADAKTRGEVGYFAPKQRRPPARGRQ